MTMADLYCSLESFDYPTGSLEYDRCNGYDLQWGSMEEFTLWLQEEASKSIKLVSCGLNTNDEIPRDHQWVFCRKFVCARNSVDLLSDLEGMCPCQLQIKAYQGTSIVLGLYNANHSHNIPQKKSLHLSEDTLSQIDSLFGSRKGNYKSLPQASPGPTRISSPKNGSSPGPLSSEFDEEDENEAEPIGSKSRDSEVGHTDAYDATIITTISSQIQILAARFSNEPPPPVTQAIFALKLAVDAVISELQLEKSILTDQFPSQTTMVTPSTAGPWVENIQMSASNTGGIPTAVKRKMYGDEGDAPGERPGKLTKSGTGQPAQHPYVIYS